MDKFQTTMRTLRSLAVFLTLIVLASFSSACGQATPTAAGSAPTRMPAPLDTLTPSSGIPALLTPTATPPAGHPDSRDTPLEPGYPAQETPAFEDPYGYPATDLTATAAAWALTLTAQPSVTATPPPATQEFTPTRAPLANPLPAPVIFIPLSDGLDASASQIWRMERDGYTLGQVTDEEAGVDYRFDVAVDGRMAYVSSNNLIVTDAGGKKRKILVTGIEPPALQEQDLWYAHKEKIVSPAWSPDGKKIAYWMDGVNLIDLTSGQAVKIIAGPPWITNAAGNLVPEEDRDAYHYYPIDWTPDGSRILLHGVGYESFSTAFVEPTQNAVVELLDIFAAGCCDYSFTRDGQMLFSSGDHTEIGLWLVNPQTGQAKNLTGGKPYQRTNGPVVVSPRQAPDGRIFFFTTPNGDIGDMDGKLLAYVDGRQEFQVPEDVTFASQAPVREGALWLPDSSRVIARDADHQLVIVDIHSGGVTPLGLHGQSLHWGVQ